MSMAATSWVEPRSRLGGDLDKQEIRRLRDREEIRELYSRYCFYVDMGMPDRFAASFSEDGVLWLSDRGSFRGREEIERHVGGRTGRTFHLIHNVSIDGIDGDKAVSHAYFQLLDPGTGATVAYGTYDDALVRVDASWRWRLKKVNYVYRSEEYTCMADSVPRPDYGRDLDGVPVFGSQRKVSR